MPKTTKDWIIETLENLVDEDLKKFKMKLCDCPTEPKIRKRAIYNADFLDLADKLVSTYTEYRAADVTVEVLESIGLMQQAADLRNGMKSYSSVPPNVGDKPTPICTAAIEKHKHCVIADNEKLVEYNSLPWESVPISERYTPLLMVRSQQPFEDQVHELMRRGSRQKTAVVTNRSEVSLDDFFHPDQDLHQPKSLILLGVAGVGKTTLVQKLMVDWARGRLYPEHFDFVFCVKCRELNLLPGKQSLVDLLLLNYSHLDSSIGEILKRPDKILFVVDGFDEFRFSIGQPLHELCRKTDEPSAVDNLLASLLRRRLLPEACLILTTRPSALEHLKDMKPDGCFEIMGFPEEHREEYFQRFFTDETVAAQAFQHIQENEVVYTMCYIPVFCWIVCTVLKEQGKFGNDYPQTATEIFVHFLIISMKYHHSSGQTDLMACLQKLCKMAARGVQENRIIFYPDEFKEAGLELRDVTSLFCQEIFVKEVVGTCTVYSFIHLTVQEFLAALSHFICEDDSYSIFTREDYFWNRPTSSLGNLSVTFRFLFGLTNPSSQKLLARHIGTLSPAATARANQWLQKKIGDYTTHSWNGSTFLNLLYALFEKNDPEVTKEVLAPADNVGLPNITLSKVDCLIIRKVFQQGDLPSNLLLNLENVDVSDGLHVLFPVLHTFGRIFLHDTQLGDEGVVLLCPALQRADCRITFLDLMNTGITDEAMPGLAAAIAQNKSLQELDLFSNKITDKSIPHIKHMALKCPTLEAVVLDTIFSEEGRQLLDNLTSEKSGFHVQWTWNDYSW
ncbi:NACHT, LRR and PYD domains-containing protein 3 isoform X1 [Amia ocellicauda]|uniref:NACHT, LRR and PYD domains-containing protein 3 isoform X1 n=1 Tax=Amia ocellicauda TaxID=2972642 RepID=UPI0034643FD4